jgi:NitT/TauT family transport system substrate-binding protein
MLQFPTSVCQAPLYVTDELLRAEGFTDITFVRVEGGVAARNLARGEVDIGLNFIAPNLVRIEAGDPVVILAGAHIGCFELLGTEGVRAIRDLKGKRIALAFGMDGPEHVFISTMASYVGLKPQREITWVAYEREPTARALEAFTTGQVDAFMAFPPVAQELRARKIGRLVVNSVTDRPWSQYFCCMVIAHRDFVRRHPVATKRAVRAILKGADLCALQPERAARTLVNQGFTDRYDYALQTMKELPYGKWREYDPADSVRFYALRLHEAGMIRSSPQKILAQGTDWRFLNELKKELKG